MEFISTSEKFLFLFGLEWGVDCGDYNKTSLRRSCVCLFHKVSYNCMFCIVFCYVGCKLILCQFLETNVVNLPTWRYANIHTLQLFVLSLISLCHLKHTLCFAPTIALRDKEKVPFINTRRLCLTRWPLVTEIPLWCGRFWGCLYLFLVNTAVPDAFP